MKTPKKHKVSIFGETYSLISDESEEHVQAAVAHIDELMRQVADLSQISDPKRIAVLVAIQCASQLKHVEDHLAFCHRKEYELSESIDRELTACGEL